MERKIRQFFHMIARVIKKGLEYLNEELWVKGFGVEEQNRICEEKKYTLVELVDLARRDWDHAKALFEEVNEPDMVDHAIYSIEAAERKYMYLLKRAKEEKVVDIPYYQIGENKLA